MLPDLSTSRRISLRVQVIGLITLALFPIGLISMYQTWTVFSEARQAGRAAMVEQTRTMAALESGRVQKAIGAARGLGAAVAAMPVPDCTQVLQSFISDSDTFIFAGFVQADGLMACSSTGDRFDFSGRETLSAALEADGTRLDVSPSGAITGLPVNIVSVPQKDARGTITGFMSLSMPHTQQMVEGAAPDGQSELQSGDPSESAPEVEFLTVTGSGQVISSTYDIAQVADILPEDATLEDLFAAAGRNFAARTAAGAPVFVTVTEVVGSSFVIVGLWRHGSAGAAGVPVSTLLPLVFPALMWAAGVLVAYFGMNRLVIRHIRELSSAMRRFALGERRVEPLALHDPAEEFASAERAFNRMALILTESEASMAQALHEKEVLLKEVHHRVKNNLQLIASIMNMQARTARSHETRETLASLQRRVRGLATLHRSLYKTTDMASIDTAAVIETIIAETGAALAEGRIEIERDLEQIEMFPDQAVPMSMLIAEAMTNVAKYASEVGPEARSARISLRLRPEDGMIEIEIENSFDPAAQPADAQESDGLGSKLMAAFVMQLDGTAETTRSATRYCYRVAFPLRGFEPEPAQAAEPGNATAA